MALNSLLLADQTKGQPILSLVGGEGGHTRRKLSGWVKAKENQSLGEKHLSSEQTQSRARDKLVRRK